MTTKYPQYYMIWCEGDRSPQVAHPDYKTARLEADRLAGKHPDKKFTILQSIETVIGVVQVQSSAHIKNGVKK